MKVPSAKPMVRISESTPIICFHEEENFATSRQNKNHSLILQHRERHCLFNPNRSLGSYALMTDLNLRNLILYGTNRDKDVKC